VPGLTRLPAISPTACFRLGIGAILAASAALAADQNPSVTTRSAADRIDFLTFAEGAVPVRVDTAAGTRGAALDSAMQLVDGAPSRFVVAANVPSTTTTTFVYELPALTTFDRFSIPAIVESPSPGVTFVRSVDVDGSVESATGGFRRLAEGTLTPGSARGPAAELSMRAVVPVRWIRVRLTGGLDIQRASMSFEFTELIGAGRRQTPAAATGFHGRWRSGDVEWNLAQQGTVVSACSTDGDAWIGAVLGTIVHATGTRGRSGTPLAAVVTVMNDGRLGGFTSTDGGAFRLFDAAPDSRRSTPSCTPAAPVLGCGSVIPGVVFAPDSAEILPESRSVLEALARGLRGETRGSLVIEAHAAVDGRDDYNLRLTARRAEAVVGVLAGEGVARDRLRAVGMGARRPLVPNADANGRSTNRRVEVQCR
jgi:hypothetical protein